MDAFGVLGEVVTDYESFVKGSPDVEDDQIPTKVLGEIEDGVLWPEPQLALNPAFEPGGSVGNLAGPSETAELRQIRRRDAVYRLVGQSVDRQRCRILRDLIAVRTRWFGSKAQGALKADGIKTIDLAKASANDDAVHVGAMHRMKGLEFRCMGVAGVGAKYVPVANADTPIDEDKQTCDQDLERERCLLFVACTHAREELLVTWHGTPSPFLTAIMSNS